MTNHKPGWAATVTGSPRDLEAILRDLPATSDPWAEADETSPERVLIRSYGWVDDMDAHEVDARASSIVEWLNGARLLTGRTSGLIKLGGLFKYRADGKRDVVIPIRTAEIRLSVGSVTVVASATTGGPAKPDPNIHRWITRAQSDGDYAELLKHLTKIDSWLSFYKAAELLKAIAGDKTALKGALSSSGLWLEFDRAWKTANYHRHAPRKTNALPKDPPSLDQARTVLLEAARQLL